MGGRLELHLAVRILHTVNVEAPVFQSLHLHLSLHIVLGLHHEVGDVDGELLVRQRQRLHGSALSGSRGHREGLVEPLCRLECLGGDIHTVYHHRGLHLHRSHIAEMIHNQGVTLFFTFLGRSLVCGPQRCRSHHP